MKEQSEMEVEENVFLDSSFKINSIANFFNNTT